MPVRHNNACLVLGMILGFMLSQVFHVVREPLCKESIVEHRLASHAGAAETEASLALLQQTVHEYQSHIAALEAKEVSVESQLLQKTKLERDCRGTLSKMYSAATGVLSSQHPDKPFLKVTLDG